MILPDAIDHHPGGERIGGAREPLSQFEPAASFFVRRKGLPAENVDKFARHFVAEVFGLAAVLNPHCPACLRSPRRPPDTGFSFANPSRARAAPLSFTPPGKSGDGGDSPSAKISAFVFFVGQFRLVLLQAPVLRRANSASRLAQLCRFPLATSAGPNHAAAGSARSRGRQNAVLWKIRTGRSNPRRDRVVFVVVALGRIRSSDPAPICPACRSCRHSEMHVLFDVVTEAPRNRKVAGRDNLGRRPCSGRPDRPGDRRRFVRE